MLDINSEHCKLLLQLTAGKYISLIVSCCWKMHEIGVKRKVPLVSIASLQPRLCNNLQFYVDYHAFNKSTLVWEDLVMLKNF